MAAAVNKPVTNLLSLRSKNAAPLCLFITRLDSSLRSFSLHVDSLRDYVLTASSGIGIALYGG